MTAARLAGLAVVAVAMALGACDPCDLGSEAGALAGAGADDCGFAALGEPATAGWACVADAFAEGRAFAFAFETPGLDSRLQRAVVRGPAGHVHYLYYDDGGALSGARIHREDCGGAYLEPADALLAEQLRVDEGALVVACAEAGPLIPICGDRD